MPGTLSVQCVQNLLDIHIFQDITHLVFSQHFENHIGRSLKGCIPDYITHIDFGARFNEPLNGCIPDSVTHLIFGHIYCHELQPGDIPNSVTHLEIKHCEKLGQRVIPDSVKFLTLGYSGDLSGIIPNSVTHLVIDYFNRRLKPRDIPDSVIFLKFKSFFNKELKPGDIPNSVTHLDFGYDFNRPLVPGVIPNSVTHLRFGRNFDQMLNPGDIPSFVTHIQFNNSSSMPFGPGVIPDTTIFVCIQNYPMFVPELTFKCCHFPRDKRHVPFYNKWSVSTSKYFNKQSFYRGIFLSKTASGILVNIPNELVFLYARILILTFLCSQELILTFLSTQELIFLLE